MVLPLSLPGVFAGVLMTFVPVSSDYVNAAVLGGTSNTMIGNIIQTQYLINQDYPTASALSFTLMAVLLIGIFVYARRSAPRTCWRWRPDDARPPRDRDAPPRRAGTAPRSATGCCTPTPGWSSSGCRCRSPS